MVAVRLASLPDDRQTIEALFGEYLRWVCPRIYEEYRAVFDAESILAHDLETLDIFMPPKGWLFLAFDDARPAGCACTRRIGEDISELKRMYVRPDHRRRGAGRMLVEATVRAVGQAGLPLLRLDSAAFMSDAHALYRSFGFRGRAAYEHSEIPPEYQEHWVFMELDLSDKVAP